MRPDDDFVRAGDELLRWVRPPHWDQASFRVHADAFMEPRNPKDNLSFYVARRCSWKDVLGIKCRDEEVRRRFNRQDLRPEDLLRSGWAVASLSADYILGHDVLRFADRGLIEKAPHHGHVEVVGGIHYANQMRRKAIIIKPD